ncbi:MAG: hypothetical protein K2H18_02925, partial [Muribaculaceae bacterium]|nr:hypothetical protein [Muribaculaceae bacterium]
YKEECRAQAQEYKDKLKKIEVWEKKRSTELDQREKQIEKDIEWKNLSYKRKLEKDRDDMIESYRNWYSEQIRAIQKEKEELEWERDSIEAFIEDREPFVSCAAYICDRKVRFLDKYEKFLIEKKIPAVRAAERVNVLKKIIKEELEEAKIIEYRLSYLTNKFPELSVLLETDEELLSLKDRNVREYKTNYDYARDYLSKEEWDRLSVTQRNQLALDRYINGRNKSAWCIGRDYEMACGYMLTSKGFDVDYHGIKNGVADLGRDIIARRQRHLFDKEFENGEEVFVIQCKYWSPNHPIRENVVMQLFGSFVGYLYENNYSRWAKNVKPVLMMPAQSVLSKEARRFIDILGVMVVRYSNMNFPRIKCNINNGEKIYHLPFDQQYDRAEIKNKGEFYAFTVEEAERAGFRRAKRHVVNT